MNLVTIAYTLLLPQILTIKTDKVVIIPTRGCDKSYLHGIRREYAV
jgi:hypothetical protein